MKVSILWLVWLPTALVAQEANSGFDLRATISGMGAYSHQLASQPRGGGSLTGGLRTMVYPTLKLSQNWTVSGAIQVHSRPYFFEQFSTQGYGAKVDVLQANLTYSRSWKDRSLVIRAGQLSSAFGAFLLRYDDADNPLIDMPMAYGYYYKGVTSRGLAGAQVDATVGKLDARAQFVNSSAANPRGLFDRDQYGHWAGGVGYTLRQGFRLGVSSYRGAYLHRQHRFYFPGEAKPRDLPGSAYGLDLQWGYDRWNIYGEWQRFQMTYRAIPTFTQHVGYAEARRVLHPRWYTAARVGYLRSSATPGRQAYEMVVGFRPNRHQLVKAGYQIQQGPAIRGTLGNTFAIQVVTVVRPISIARD